jgi:hypothetical protein
VSGPSPALAAFKDVDACLLVILAGLELGSWILYDLVEQCTAVAVARV